MGYVVTVRDETGLQIASKRCANEGDTFEAIRLDGLPKHWFIVVETDEGTPLGDRLMPEGLKPVPK